jgi:PAS domain S-box-containing protein
VSSQTTQDRLELATIAETMSDVVLSNGLDGTIHRWSASAERLFGYRAEEIVGESLRALAASARVNEIEDLLARVRQGETIRQFDTIRCRKDGTGVYVSLSITPVQSRLGEILGAAAAAFDISERKRREEIRRFLTEANRLLAVSFDHSKTLTRVADLMLSNLAEWCIVDVFDVAGSPLESAVAHCDPAKAELAREMRRRYPPGAGWRDISFRVFTAGEPDLVQDVSDDFLRDIARDSGQLAMLCELAPKSLMVVPLQTRERTVGTILLANGESRWRFSREDLGLAEDLARWAAVVIDNATLNESERRARWTAERTADRIGNLQVVTAALSRASTPQAVAQAFVREAVAAAGADGGFVRLLTRNRRTLKLEATVGYSKLFEETYKRISPTSALPGAMVFRTGCERYFGSANEVRMSPEFAREYVTTGHEAIAFVPLHGDGGPIGLIALSYLQPRVFDDDEREFLKALAGQCAEALVRARLYEDERRARAEAALAVEHTGRLQFLAAELAGALTPAAVAEVVVAQGVSSFGADTGALELIANDGTVVAVVCGQALHETQCHTQQNSSLSSDPGHSSPDALQWLAPVFFESEKDMRDHRHGMTNCAHAMETLSDLRARAGVLVPLVFSSRALGVLVLGFARPRRFPEVQRSFALAFGRQCTQALKRAQLYEAELEGRSALSRLVERLHEGVLTVDRRGRVEFASSKARAMLSDLRLEEGGLVPEAWHGFPLRGFAASLFAIDAHVVERRVVDDGDEQVFDVTGIPAGRTEAVVLVVTDGSARERRRRAEREFVDNAAHELRAPLAVITSAIERLQAGARDVPEKRDRFLDHIERESARLNRLAASLLGLSRAQLCEEDPRLEQITLRELLEEVFGRLHIHRGVELILVCPADVVATTNRDLLEHAVSNLATNSARHTESGRILVCASADGGFVKIEINDTGVGIAAGELEHVFKRFYRGESARAGAGSGLGLAIAKAAVEALGGRIEIESVLGVGTTSRIQLPHQTPSFAG